MIRMHAVQDAGRFALAALGGVARLWARVVKLTGARGGAWVVGGLILGDAFFVAACTHSTRNGSTVSSLLSAWGERSAHGCWQPSTRDMVVATQVAPRRWSVQALTAENYQTLWNDGNVQVKMSPSRYDSTGIWSPWLVTEYGRYGYLFGSGLTANPDEPAIRQAIIDAWPTLAAVHGAVYAEQPLRPDEIDAFKTGGRVARTSINWFWLANDLFVLTAGVLLCGSQSVRSARWRENARKRQSARRQLVEFRCSACRYALGGLPMSSAGECRCPECGRVNVAA